MTAEEKSLMANPERKPLMDLPPVVQVLMNSNIKYLRRLDANGNWVSCKEFVLLARGHIFSVDQDIVVEQPAPVQYKQYPVFCGSDNIFKADLTQPNSDFKRIKHLVTVTGMAGFAGIRYKGSQVWRSTVNIMSFGEPMEVRFTIQPA